MSLRIHLDQNQHTVDIEMQDIARLRLPRPITSRLGESVTRYRSRCRGEWTKPLMDFSASKRSPSGIHCIRKIDLAAQTPFSYSAGADIRRAIIMQRCPLECSSLHVLTGSSKTHKEAPILAASDRCPQSAGAYLRRQSRTARRCCSCIR